MATISKVYKKIDFLKNKSRKAIFLSFFSAYTTLVWKIEYFCILQGLQKFFCSEGTEKIVGSTTGGVLVLKNFSKFTGKQLCPTVTLLRKKLWHRCFPVNFAKFLRAPFLQNTSGRLFVTCWKCWPFWFAGEWKFLDFRWYCESKKSA